VVTSLIVQALWLALAVTVSGVLHMVVVKKDLFSALRVPIDGGRTVGGERLFGDNKTWRGVVFMVAATALLGAVQGLAGGTWATSAGIAPMDFGAWGLASGALAQATGYALVNAVLGLGYVVGELPNSFAKRRLNITPGKTDGGLTGKLFLVIDQADSVIAALVIGALLFGWSLAFVLVGIGTLTLLHLAFNFVLYVVKVRKNF
jgi:hypothetical protein